MIVRESGFNLQAVNKVSGACGLGQALPCSKMNCPLDFKGADCQIKWVINYVQKRYGDPIKAYAHWLARVPISGKDVGHWY